MDKISETPKGDEITGILTHLTDTSQNSQFHDKYFTEINFDLWNCELWVAKLIAQGS